MADNRPRTKIVLDTHPHVEFIVAYGPRSETCVLAVIGGEEQANPQDLWEIAREECRLKNAAHTLLLEVVPQEMTAGLGQFFDAAGETLVQIGDEFVREDGSAAVGEVREARGFLPRHEPEFVFGELDRKISVFIPFLPFAARAAVTDALQARFADQVTLAD